MSHLFKTIFAATAITLLISASPIFSQTLTPVKAESISTEDSCAGFKVLLPKFFPLTGSDASAIKTFDVNNDGVHDLLVTLPNDNKIAVQLGDGEGGISTTAYFDTGANPKDLDLGDFNRDGEIDVITANASANKFSLLLGDGAGNFSLYASYTSEFSPQLLKAGYFDNDGYLDVAVANGSTLKIFKGNRDLTFNQISNITTAYDPRKIISSDFNGDGKTDLAISFFGGGAGSEVRVYLGQGDGNFNLTKTFPGIQAAALSAADMDGTGTPDLIANDFQTARFLTYKGNGDGTFQEPIISNIGSVYGSEIIDFNDDGKLDLVSGGGAIFLGDGLGGFSFLTNGGTEGSASSVGVADFNSDNVLDIAVISSNGNPNNGTSIVINKRAGKIVGGPLFYVNRPYEVDSADFNLDGRFDFVTTNAYNNLVFVYLQNEQGGFAPANPSGISLGIGFNAGPFSVTTADFNGDNKPDFAAPDGYSGKVVVFIGNGDGTFVKNVFSLSSTGVRPSDVRTGDFNNDGKTDIIVLNSSSRDYSVLLNDGAGGFNLLPGVNISFDATNNVVAIGDITNDGKLDLVVGRPAVGELIYLTGNGDGTFVRQPWIIAGLGNVSSLILTDLNNDRHLDLIIGGNQRMIVTFGVGNGGFFNPVSYPISGYINDLELQDFDLDGIKDLVAAAGDPTNSIIFFKGVGNGAYNQGVTMSVNVTPTSITSKDFNSDGKPDFVFSSASGGRVSVVYNETNISSCLSVNDAQVNEGNSGTTNISFEVKLSNAASQPVSVDYKTIGRTAESSADFVQTSGNLVFPAGTTTQTVNLTVNGDVLDEDDETFTLTLSNPSNVVITDGVGVARIIDNDSPPGLSIGNASVVEGDTGTTILSLPVNLSGASGRRIKAQVSTEAVTAASNQDYQSISEKIFFDAGEVSKNILISVNPDYRVEPDETLNVNLTAPVNVNLTNNQATATILNDDVGGVIQFSASSVSVSESGSTAAIIVSRTDGNASDVVVQYNTIDGTAKAGKDYQTVTGNLTFGANETSKTISVPILNDALNEDTETFSLSLQNVSGGGTLGGQTSITVNLQDNDPLPQLSVSNYSVAEGNSGLTTINLSLNLLAVSGREVSIKYATQNGTAAEPNDYLSATGTVNFAAGETSKTIQLSIVGDATFEPDETFNFVLSNAVNGEISNGFANITILNDDAAPKRPSFDFDGDGKSDISVFRPSLGSWYLLQSSNNSFFGLSFGLGTDVIAPADYDGDSKTDFAVFRADTGNWYLQQSKNGFAGVQFGQNGDIPVPSDYDGDGKADIAVYRPSTGGWYRLNSSNGQFVAVAFGTAEDKPTVGDFDGDGKADIAVFRPSTANWFCLNSSNNQFVAVPFGAADDKLTPADFDGDGKTDIAVYRPSTGGWYRLNSSNGEFVAVGFGTAEDKPVAADYDGDGKADIAVFRPSDGNWYLLRSTAGFAAIRFGQANDNPIPNAFVP